MAFPKPLWARITLREENHATPERVEGPVPRPPRLRTRMAYLLPFEIVSVHLLVVLIGAAYLARSKRRRGGTP